MLFDALARTSLEVAESSARLTKIRLIADCLRAAEPADVPIVVAYLAGELRQRRTGLGPAALRDLPSPATEPTLTATEVDAAFATMSERPEQARASNAETCSAPSPPARPRPSNACWPAWSRASCGKERWTA